MSEFKTYLELSTGDEVDIIVTYDYFSSETVYHESMRILDVTLVRTGESIAVKPATIYDLERRAYDHINAEREKREARLEDYHEGKAADKKLDERE